MLPSKYQEVQEVMETILHEAKFAQKLDRPSLAYTYARMNELCGTIYRIYVNNSDPELAKFLYVHECGHIIFGHAKNMNTREDNFLRIKIASAYDKVRDVFESPESLFDLFRSLIYNMVMDFEVNSKLYTPEEWEYMNSLVQKALKDPDQWGLWPADFGYDAGLTWNEYLNLILMNPQIFMERLKARFDLNGNEDGGHPEDDEEGETHSPISKQIRFTPEDIERLRKIAGDHNGATFSAPNGNMQGFTRKQAGAVGIDFTEFENQEDLLRMVKKLLYVQSSDKGRRDQLYNLNRNKYNSNVLIPKNVQYVNHRKAKLFLLFDVSGSVEPKAVFNLISTFRKFSKDFKNTRIVSWSTMLVDEWGIEDKIPNNYGGGTDIAPGIQYMNQKYELKKDDVLFVISDFNDQLSDWKPVLNSLHCKKFAINWNWDNAAENPGFAKVLKALNRNSLKE